MTVQLATRFMTRGSVITQSSPPGPVTPHYRLAGAMLLAPCLTPHAKPHPLAR